jgi:hypothetical protein
MTQQEKQAECERICGESGKHGMHRIAPVICPIKEDEWKNPKRKNDYGVEFK